LFSSTILHILWTLAIEVSWSITWPFQYSWWMLQQQWLRKYYIQFEALVYMHLCGYLKTKMHHSALPCTVVSTFWLYMLKLCRADFIHFFCHLAMKSMSNTEASCRHSFPSFFRWALKWLISKLHKSYTKQLYMPE